MKIYDITYPYVRKFLNLNKEIEIVSYLLNKDDTKKYDQQHLNIFIPSKPDIPLYIKITNKNKTFCFTTFKNNFDDFGIFIPGEIYDLCVIQEGKEIYKNKIKIKDEPVRFINVANLDNVRDLGGWKTIDGHKIKYELLYRGSKLSDSTCGYRLSSESLRVLDYLNIKTELDFRWENGDDDGQKFSPLNAKYLKISLSAYNSILPDEDPNRDKDTQFYKGTAKAIKEVFECFANKDNYPIYMHCIGGSDRTGTISFLLLGLLGVPLETLIKEYEITSFFPHSLRVRATIKNNKVDSSGFYFGFKDGLNIVSGFNYFVNKFIEGYAIKYKPFSKAVENYLINYCKISKTTLNNIRKLLLVRV